MKALVLEEYGKFVYRDMPDPAPGAGEVLVKVMACAVCGSDVHGMDGSTGRRIPPIIMGHEAAGVVTALGEGAEGVALGQRVTFDSTVYCGECDFCQSGRVNLCSNRRVLGVSCQEYRMHGAFADQVAVPARLIYALPEGVSFPEAAMVEPLSVAYHAATRTDVKGRRCIVVGAGTIGMLVVQVLRALGASNIIAVDIDADKRAFALAHGADDAVDSTEPGALRQLIDMTGGGADVCFDAVGINQTVNLTIEATVKGGAAVLVGNLAPRCELPLQSVVTREIRVFGSCASAGEYDACLRLIAERRVDVLAMISRCVPLREGDEWIHRVKAGELGLSKIVLIPDGGGAQ